MDNFNIILIGMPSSGKTSTGRIISELMKRTFVDTDLLITQLEKKKPSKIVAESGLDEFLRLQEDAILTINMKNLIISTGGAVIYSEKAMQHLKQTGKVFFLDEDIDTINERLDSSRKLARTSQKSLKDVYEERYPLYKKYADHIIDCRQKNEKDIANQIVNMIE